MNEQDKERAVQCQLITSNLKGIYVDTLQEFADLIRADERAHGITHAPAELLSNPKQLERKPLTDEWIRQTSTIWSGIQSEKDEASMTAKDMTEFDCLKWLVRKTEAAHNIGANHE